MNFCCLGKGHKKVGTYQLVVVADYVDNRKMLIIEKSEMGFDKNGTTF